MDLSKRIFVPEAMEAPVCEAGRLRRTYRQLAVINRTISRIDDLVCRPIVDHARQVGTPASVLEVGCGGGDVLARLSRMSRRAKLNLQLVGMDSDPRAIARAHRHYGDDPRLRFTVGDLEHVGGQFDYVFCNHVLHHIPPNNLVPFLQRLSQLKRRRLLVNDLERSPFAYLFFTIAAGLFFHRSFVFSDGRLSIRKGFQQGELVRACQDAGLKAYHVRRIFPWRLVISEGVQDNPIRSAKANESISNGRHPTENGAEPNETTVTAVDCRVPGHVCTDTCSVRDARSYG